MKFTKTKFANNTQYKTDEDLFDKICTDFNQFKGKMLGKGSYGSAYDLKGFEKFFRNGENIVVKEINSGKMSKCQENHKIKTPSGYKYNDVFYCEGDNQVLAEYYISLAASMLNSENFIGTYVYKDCENSNKQYIFMEKIDTTFRKFMENPNRDQRVFDAVVVQILHALWCLHKAGINHNDTKADNIFILEAKNYKNRDGFNLSDFDYVKYDFGDDDSVIYIPVKDMKFIVKIGDYGLSQKYSEPAVLTDFIHTDFLVDKLAPLYDIMLAFSENGHYTSPLYKTIQTYLVGFGESINLVTGHIDHKKAKEKWTDIKCICDDSCPGVNKLDKIIKNEDVDSLKKNFGAKNHDYIENIRCIYFNYKDEDRDRRQIYNFLLSNMKTTDLDVTKIIKTGFFREQMEMYGWYTPDSNNVLPFGGPGEYGGYANDSIRFLPPPFA